MKTEKILLKFLLLSTVAIALQMALLGWFDSYSQSATSEHGDWMLRTYLNGLMLVFAILGVTAKDKAERINLSWAKISFRWVCFFVALMAWGVDATNVVDYSLEIPESTSALKRTLHMIFTALTIGGSGFLGWHFFQKKTIGRNLAMIAVAVGITGFLGGFKFGWYSIAWGELIPTVAISAIVWPIINEQLNK